MSTLSNRVLRLSAELEAIDQAHVLRYADKLTPEQLSTLCDQIESFGISRLATLAERCRLNDRAIYQRIAAYEPAQYHRLQEQKSLSALRSVGETALRAGKVAACVVAGGQGSRLGFNGPKGIFPATPLRKVSLFQCFAEQLIAAEARYGVTIPWYIMTSPENDLEVRAFFEENHHFGREPANDWFFKQGVLPTFDEDGYLLMDGPDHILTNPDGHGGCLKALMESGATKDMHDRGITEISYFQVDNPLVEICDPLFLGLHIAGENSSHEASAKVLKKRGPDEPVGVFVKDGTQTRIVEYSNLPKSLATATTRDGRLRFDAASPAIHLFSLDFLEGLLSRGDFKLPLNVAHKVAPYFDLDLGCRVNPTEPNALKLETFVFDAFPLAKKVALLEVDRRDSFAPIKGQTGDDSPAFSIALQNDRAARWLEAAGVSVPRKTDGSPDCTIEISPLFALDAAELATKKLPTAIAPGENVVFK